MDNKKGAINLLFHNSSTTIPLETNHIKPMHTFSNLLLQNACSGGYLSHWKQKITKRKFPLAK